MFKLKEVDLSLLTEKEKGTYHFCMRMQSQTVELTKEFSDKVIKKLLGERKKKIENAIWGFVIGDCLGVPYEFKEKGMFKYKEMHGFGTHNQPPMTWSDDTSLMLALLDSFENGKFNIEKHKENLKLFLSGKYTVDNMLFDIGIGTLKAIQKEFDIDTSNSLGNGGLLRCWLVGILNREQLSEFLVLTHSADELYLTCCNLYIALLDDILQLGKDDGTKKWLFENNTTFETLINANEKLSKTEGCIVETIRIVISSYLKGKTVKAVIELGGDTDSNAALFCTLKGAEGDNSVLQYKIYIRQLEQVDHILESFN